MSGFIEGENRYQATMFPERLDDYIAEDCSVRVIDVFIDELDISLDSEPDPTTQADPPTTRQRCSSFMCTVTSIVCTQVGAWNEKRNAMLN